jgi:two-component system nitrate/nitrite response regulator NarL
MIRVLIVADIRLYRDGLADILGRRALLDVVGSADSSAAAIARAVELSPDLILVDEAMPESSAAIRSLLALRPAAKIIALGVGETEGEVIACAEAGVSGYVARQASLEDLVAVVDSVGRGELLCSPRAAASLLRRVALQAAGGADAGPASRLTSREGQIVRLIEQGLSNKEIASRLGIEVATVKNHVHNILEKLQVRRRAEAAAHVRGHAPLRSRSPVVP